MQLTINEAQKILSKHLDLEVNIITEQAYAASLNITKPNEYLKKLTIGANLPACGDDIIKNADETFTYIDSDFKNRKLTSGQKANTQTLELYEITKDAKLKQMFESLGVDLDKLCLTQSQIIEFCKNHKNLLRTDGYATFFLFRKDEKLPAKPDNLFVAIVYFDDDGLNVHVSKFEYDDVWNAEYRHRVVLPQLTL